MNKSLHAHKHHEDKHAGGDPRSLLNVLRKQASQAKFVSARPLSLRQVDSPMSDISGSHSSHSSQMHGSPHMGHKHHGLGERMVSMRSMQSNASSNGLRGQLAHNASIRNIGMIDAFIENSPILVKTDSVDEDDDLGVLEEVNSDGEIDISVTNSSTCEDESDLDSDVDLDSDDGGITQIVDAFDMDDLFKSEPLYHISPRLLTFSVSQVWRGSPLRTRRR
jgi:hypothetical protein